MKNKWIETKPILDILTYRDSTFEYWKNLSAEKPETMDATDDEKDEEIEDESVDPNTDVVENSNILHALVLSHAESVFRNCCTISEYRPWFGQSPITLLNRMTLRHKYQGDLRETSPAEALNDKELTGFFFSSHACGPCKDFLPYLIEFYKSVQENGESFEIVYVPQDNDESTTTHFVEHHGNWFIAPLGDTIFNKLAQQFSIKSVPSLCIVNSEGNLITKDARADVQKIGPDAIQLWKKGEKALSKEDEDSFWEELYPSWKPITPIELVSTPNLLQKQGEELVELSTDDALKDVEIVGFYFREDDVEERERFTKFLINCYEGVKERNGSFEVVYVSEEESEQEMREFILQTHGDWLAIPYNKELSMDIKKRFGVDSLSGALVLLNKIGEIINDRGDMDVRVKGSSAYRFWKRKKPAYTNEEHQQFMYDHFAFYCREEAKSYTEKLSRKHKKYYEVYDLFPIKDDRL